MNIFQQSKIWFLCIGFPEHLVAIETTVYNLIRFPAFHTSPTPVNRQPIFNAQQRHASQVCTLPFFNLIPQPHPCLRRSRSDSSSDLPERVSYVAFLFFFFRHFCLWPFQTDLLLPAVYLDISSKKAPPRMSRMILPQRKQKFVLKTLKSFPSRMSIRYRLRPPQLLPALRSDSDSESAAKAKETKKRFTFGSINDEEVSTSSPRKVPDRK